MDEAPDNRLHAEQTDAIEQLSALGATTDSQILGIIGAAEESKVWMVDSSPSLVEWVAWRCRLTRAEARRHVEVADALASLPKIAARLDEGSLSFSQVTVLVDFVEPDGDAEWAEKARGMHVEQLRAWRRAARRVTSEEAIEDNARRSLMWWWDPNKRFLKIKGPASCGCCRFPGCERRRRLHTHHVEHWTREGPTDLDNLLMLCTFHHKLVHEGCWDIRGKPDGDIVFIRPDGRDFVPLRPRLRDDIRERILWPSRTGVPSAMELCVNASSIPT